MESKQRIYMPEIHTLLRSSVPQLFEKLYQTKRKKHNEPSTSDSSNVFMYRNPHKLVEVHPSLGRNDTVEEYVFTCLVRDDSYSNRVLREYFISDEYNISDDTSESYIAGRFVFVERPNGLGMSLFALAEEPAQTLSMSGYYEAERLYLRRRQEKDLGE